MRKHLYVGFFCICLIACNNSRKETTPTIATTEKTAKDSIVFPYQPLYSSSFSNEVPDKDLLTVLNSYKFWESGFLVDLADLYADTVVFIAPDGNIYNGAKAGLLDTWTKKREDIKTIQVQVITWTKLHETLKGDNFIDVWYRETDTYKNGKVETANFADRKQLRNGKIIWYSQYRQDIN